MIRNQQFIDGYGKNFVFQASEQDIARYKREQMLFRWQLVRDYVKQLRREYREEKQRVLRNLIINDEKIDDMDMDN